MPAQPIASNENLILAAQGHDAALGADGAPFEAPAEPAPDEGAKDGVTNETLLVDEPEAEAEVGLAQKGTGEDAVVRRETEI